MIKVIDSKFTDTNVLKNLKFGQEIILYITWSLWHSSLHYFVAVPVSSAFSYNSGSSFWQSLVPSQLWLYNSHRSDRLAALLESMGLMYLKTGIA